MCMQCENISKIQAAVEYKYTVSIINMHNKEKNDLVCSR